MAIVTEITAIEEVEDGDGNLLYVDYLVAVFDRDPRDPPAAKCLGTEVVRLSETQGQRRARHLDPITFEEIDNFTINPGVSVTTTVSQMKSNAQSRIVDREENKKWRAGRLFSSSR